MQIIEVRSHRRTELIDVTAGVAEIVSAANIDQGVALVYVPHTTAGVTINENADPDVGHDLLGSLEELVPHHRPSYQHREGNSDAHVKASLVGSSVWVIIEHGQLQLGTWQGIYFCEFDGPRSRRLMLQIS